MTYLRPRKIDVGTNIRCYFPEDSFSDLEDEMCEYSSASTSTTPEKNKTTKQYKKKRKKTKRLSTRKNKNKRMKRMKPPFLSDEDNENTKNNNKKYTSTPQKLKETHRKAQQNERILIPNFRVVKDYNKNNNKKFQRPKKYITYQPKKHTEIDKVEYEVDSDDEDFVCGLNSTREFGRKKQNITEEKFENLIDFLEKEYIFNRKDTLLPLMFEPDPEDVICSICNFSAFDDSNKILYCDGCDLSVHQKCYKVDKIPPGNWYCDACKNSDVRVVCELCNKPGRGAFRRVLDKEGCWCHISCARGLPVDVCCEVERGGEHFIGLDESGIPEEYLFQPCFVCGEREGVCFPCEETCERYFHVSCAQRNGLFVDTHDPGDCWKVYCRKHSFTEEALKQRNSLLLCKTFSKEQWSNLMAVVGSSRRDLKMSPKVLEIVYKYWLLKRGNYGKPLIPRLQYYAKQEADRLKSEKKIKAMESTYLELIKVRQFLERMRILVDLSKKRENLKIAEIQNQLDCLDLAEKEKKGSRVTRSQARKEKKLGRPRKKKLGRPPKSPGTTKPVRGRPPRKSTGVVTGRKRKAESPKKSGRAVKRSRYK